MNYKVGILAVLALILLIFLAQNIEVVTVNFLIWEISMSLAVMIFFLLLIGLMIGWLMHGYLSYRKDKKRNPA